MLEDDFADFRDPMCPRRQAERAESYREGQRAGLVEGSIWGLLVGVTFTASLLVCYIIL